MMDDGFRGLDIGTGYGGWVRLIAMERQRVRKIEGLELQGDIYELAVNFSRWALEPVEELQGRVKFTNGDVRSVLGHSRPGEPLRDFIISFLALLHIGQDLDQKLKLFEQIAVSLKFGGRVYIEDLVVLPVALSDPRYRDKVQRVVWMNALPTHGEYANMIEDAGFIPVGNATSVAYDVTAAWKRFVWARSTQFQHTFQELMGETSLCLQDTGRVMPARTGVECLKLDDLLGDRSASIDYIDSQSAFFCEVCELFNGKGQLAEESCGCELGSWTAAERDSRLYDHPPLLGGVFVFAERAAPTAAMEEL